MIRALNDNSAIDPHYYRWRKYSLVIHFILVLQIALREDQTRFVRETRLAQLALDAEAIGTRATEFR